MYYMRYIAYGMAACSSNEETTTEPKPKQEEQVQENRKLNRISKQQKKLCSKWKMTVSKQHSSDSVKIQHRANYKWYEIHMSLQKLTFWETFMFRYRVM